MPAAAKPKLRRAHVILLLILSAIGAMAPVASATARTHTGSRPVARADRRATERYLTAQYHFDREILANRSASNAASTAYAGRVSAECPGVLAGAPDFAALFESATKPTHEQLSQFQQYEQLNAELISNLFDAWFSVNREAARTTAEALRPVHWSKAAITRLVKEELVQLEELVPTGLPDICAHMRAWVASGYRTLPPGVAESDALGATSSASAAASKAAGPSLDKLLARTEGPRQRTLFKRIERLKNRFAAALEPVGATLQRLDPELGIRRAIPDSEPASDEGVVVGRGKTHRSS